MGKGFVKLDETTCRLVLLANNHQPDSLADNYSSKERLHPGKK
jgi:hypothetical protein